MIKMEHNLGGEEVVLEWDGVSRVTERSDNETRS